MRISVRYTCKNNALFFRDFSTDNLKYLSVDQALEDVAYFIEYQKAINQSLADSKVKYLYSYQAKIYQKPNYIRWLS